MMERLARGCMARRGLVFGLALGLAALSAAVLTKARLDSDLVALFLSDDSEADAYHRWRDRFDASEPAVLGIPHAAPTSPEALRALTDLERRLRALDDVSSVLSLASAPRITDEAGVLAVSTWGRSFADAQSDEARAALREELAADERVTGALIAPGGDALLVLVQMAEEFQQRPPADQLALEQRLRDAVADSGLARADEVHAAGFPIVISMMLEISVRHLVTLVPLAVLVLVLVVLFLYRRLWPAIFAVIIATLSNLFAGAAAVAFDPRVTPLHTIAPVLITVISLADTVFVLNAFVRAREDGHDEHEAIARALAEVGPACVLTSVSTFASFATFLLIPARAMQLLGVAAGVGVASALLLIVTLGPALLRTLPTPTVRTGRGTRRFLDGVVQATRSLAEGHPRLVAGGALLALVGSLALVPRLEVETDWGRRMSPDHRLPRAQAWMQERFGGVSTLEAAWTPAEGGAQLAPEVLRAQLAFRERALAHEDVLGELSPASALLELKRALTGSDDVAAPATTAEVAQLRVLAELGGEDPLASLLGRGSASRSVLRVSPTGLRELAALARELDAVAREVAPPDAAVEVTGLSVMLGTWIDNLLRAQINGVGLVALMSVLVLAFGLRSLRAGVFALLPNSLPVALFLATLALPGAHFDSDYLLVCVIGLGIAVDDTIHFLTRFRAASRAGLSREDALSEAYRSAGGAMIETTLILVVGLSPLLLSDYLSARMFFTELSKVLIGALIADLLLLPAMIRLGWIRFAPPADG